MGMRQLTRPAPRRVRSASAFVLVALGTVVPLALVTGCGLINSDLATVSFDLPPKTYTFDTGQSDWAGAMSSAFATVPVIACDPVNQGAECCPAQLGAAGIDCTKLTCDAASGSCAFTVLVTSPPQPIDLKNEGLPSSLSSQSILDITVKKLQYDVSQNSLNIDLPPVDLYLGPQGTTSVGGAVKFATVPAIPSGVTLSNGNIPIDANANAAFENIGMHLGTPFVFLAQTKVVIPGGTPAPTGAMTFTVKGQLSAKPNL